MCRRVRLSERLGLAELDEGNSVRRESSQSNRDGAMQRHNTETLPVPLVEVLLRIGTMLRARSATRGFRGAPAPCKWGTAREPARQAVAEAPLQQ